MAEPLIRQHLRELPLYHSVRLPSTDQRILTERLCAIVLAFSSVDAASDVRELCEINAAHMLMEVPGTWSQDLKIPAETPG